MKTTKVLETQISNTNISEVADILTSNIGVTVAICNTNTVVRCRKNIYLQKVINGFDIKTPDGFPIAKSLSIFNKKKQARVDGYKVFLETIEQGLSKKTSHYFFGSNNTTTDLMIKKLQTIYPEIIILGKKCPEFMTHHELAIKYHKHLSQIDADIIWVSLGFPKQELFIDEINQISRLHQNLVGVGAVFEWVAETKVKAPEWLANLGIEWVFRLVQEPRRLFKRYLIDNTLFVYYFLNQIFRKSQESEKE